MNSIQDKYDKFLEYQIMLQSSDITIHILAKSNQKIIQSVCPRGIHPTGQLVNSILTQDRGLCHFCLHSQSIKRIYHSPLS